MSSAKSRNFRRRSGDDEDEDARNFVTPSATKTNGTPATTNKPSTTNKPKKPTPQSAAKNLLSFADDDDEESPFSRPPPKPSSSSRFPKSSSAHKLTSSKDRIAPHPPSSSLPSNVQPQAGVYTKEALLELQKNTKTLAAPARNRPKPDPGPVVVLKGLIKPVVSSALDAGATGKGQDSSDDDMVLDRKDKDSGVEAQLMDIRIGPGFRDDKEGIPDQATIEAIRAKRERLRQARAAAPDYIALDGGSNHGEAEGLSDEEPEFQGRIGFFGDKIGGRDKKGVFEDFEERPLPKERGMEVVSDEEDEEDKMWEEEQVRKGLGKRLDEGLGSQGAGAAVGGVSSIRPSGMLPSSFGYPGAVPSGMHHPAQNVDGRSSYNSVGGASFDMFGSGDMSISQQAELARKAMTENLKRIQESHARTIVSLAKTEENLSSSLLNVTSLEDSLSAADEKFRFMQKLRDYVSAICEFLQHKAPFIEELEEQMQKLHEERARAIIERRAADNVDEISEIELAIAAARAELRKGSSAEKVAAAITPSQAASSNARAAKGAPVELDEFGRDVNLQKRMDITRRSEARKRRRAKADSKRKLAMENDSSVQLMEGEFSTDESDSENSAHESTHNQLLQVAGKILSDGADKFSQFSMVVEKFEKWKTGYATSYRDAYMYKSIPAIFSPYVRLELLKWDPLHEDADFRDMEWYSLLLKYPEDENGKNGEEADGDTNLIPQLVEKLLLPILHHQLAFCYDILSTRETKYAVSAMFLASYCVGSSSEALGKLLTVLLDRLTNAVNDLVVPTWSPLEVKAVPDAARVAAYRFGTSVRLLRNISLWSKVLALPVVEKIALDGLLCGKILPHLHSIQANVHEAIIRTERVIASLYDVWTGPSVKRDQSKLQPLVDYLLLLGKTVERKHVSGGMESETGKLVRRLKKMLVELNEYDHARALSRSFNLKEAL
ncbi:transcriptional repressor ILP1 [Salvia miltiorrhiza]|uniref:transcriptional repressor ILP1 n=1 Tax=Salvia miltiorrhiza TaxID=226208 RepID=UPI0025AD5433|nr:transcriptional repressor ILP1 [Salvia miltiorrhiza]XP_057810118.1 transcriptional repressor ILP1 [Salvia miltiorrhiza]XP_057810119.1 transcriptional repressor ILP1 [Salvia miltiorrhiza]XP_057810120.1 transcriptional repressor ILP1 [Salvia miltiorrhiza]